jgi:anhydro-N-acetylmuramic acid kinase
MDGVDAALVELSGPHDKPRVRLRAFVSAPYPRALRDRILRVAGGAPTPAGEISQLNFLLGELFAEAALALCRRGKVSPRRLEVIGSHGQTIFHQGALTLEAGRRIASTLQIAESAVITERTGVPAVADFRTADMAAGGHGAPLVPMVDYLLLRDEREGRVALNVGGIANITVIPANAKPENVFGFDTGPGNMVIDALVRHFTRGRENYDVGGRLGTRGKVIEPLLAELLRLPFFRRKPPKSAGREQFGDWFVKEFFLKRRAKHADLLRTATELTARTIAQALERSVFPRVKIHRLVVSGGGAHNRLLMRRLRESLPQLAVCLSDQYGLPVDAKEAIAFAVLADRTMHGLPGNLPSVTGAERPAILGKIVLP